MTNDFKIFFSYSWVNKNIAEIIDKDFLELGLQLTRDTRDMPYGQIIKSFTQTIARHDYVLMLVSHDYLTSKNCMLEVVVLLNNSDSGTILLPVMYDHLPNIFK